EDTRILRRTPPPERISPADRLPATDPLGDTVLGPPPAPVSLPGFVPPRPPTPSTPFMPAPPSAPGWNLPHLPSGPPHPPGPSTRGQAQQQPPFMLQPWVLIVIATFVGLLAFVITRAFIR